MKKAIATDDPGSSTRTLCRSLFACSIPPLRCHDPPGARAQQRGVIGIAAGSVRGIVAGAGAVVSRWGTVVKVACKVSLVEDTQMQLVSVC